MHPWLLSSPSISSLAEPQAPPFYKGLPPYQLSLGRCKAFPLFIKAKKPKKEVKP
jgi:hypothetical protein